MSDPSSSIRINAGRGNDAGLLEGALTAPEIKSFYVNTRSSISDEDRDALSTHIFLPELLFLDR